jgi:hypothetical protein
LERLQNPGGKAYWTEASPDPAFDIGSGVLLEASLSTIPPLISSDTTRVVRRLRTGLSVEKIAREIGIEVGAVVQVRYASSQAGIFEKFRASGK